MQPLPKLHSALIDAKPNLASGQLRARYLNPKVLPGARSPANLWMEDTCPSETSYRY